MIAKWFPFCDRFTAKLLKTIDTTVGGAFAHVLLFYTISKIGMYNHYIFYVIVNHKNSRYMMFLNGYRIIFK